MALRVIKNEIDNKEDKFNSQTFGVKRDFKIKFKKGIKRDE